MAFQSTLPHGERPYSSSPVFGLNLFQSTLPHGERPGPTGIMRPSGRFQSTLPHGERRNRPPARRPRSRYFNPRSRMGSDVSMISGSPTLS